MRVLRVIVFFFMSCAGAYAQLPYGTSHIFPQFADGAFPDGSSYRSTVIVQKRTAGTATCAFSLTGMTAIMESGAFGASFSLATTVSGWTTLRTTGTQPFQGGYAVLNCNADVFAMVLYSFYIRGVKASEATVFSSLKDTQANIRIMADQTETARLGFALANDTDRSRTYRISLVSSAGSTVANSDVVLNARRSTAMFLDELVPTSRNQALEAQIVALDGNPDPITAIGLRFTGPAFTTIPANPFH